MNREEGIECSIKTLVTFLIGTASVAVGGIVGESVMRLVGGTPLSLKLVFQWLLPSAMVAALLLVVTQHIETAMRHRGVAERLSGEYKIIGDGLWLLEPAARGLADDSAKMKIAEVEVLSEKLKAEGLFFDLSKFSSREAQEIAYELSAIARHKGVKAVRERVGKL